MIQGKIAEPDIEQGKFSEFGGVGSEKTQAHNSFAN